MQRQPHQFVPLIPFGDDHVGLIGGVRLDGAAGPRVRRGAETRIAQDVHVVPRIDPGDDDAGLVRGRRRGDGGIDGHDDPDERRRRGGPAAVDPRPLPEGAFHIFKELRLQLLTTEATALIPLHDLGEEGRRQVRGVPERRGHRAGHRAITEQGSVQGTGFGVVVMRPRGSVPSRRPNSNMSQADCGSRQAQSSSHQRVVLRSPESLRRIRRVQGRDRAVRPPELVPTRFVARAAPRGAHTQDARGAFDHHLTAGVHRGRDQRDAP